MADATCSVDGCQNAVKARKMCGKHWQQWRKIADPAEVQLYGRNCQVDGCTRKHQAQGYCNLHYNRLWRHGEPLVELIAPRIKSGPENHQWKDGNISYYTAHQRVRDHKGKASEHLCVDCGEQAAQWSYTHDCPDELTRRGLRYSADPARYVARCTTCHGQEDAAFRRAVS